MSLFDWEGRWEEGRLQLFPWVQEEEWKAAKEEEKVERDSQKEVEGEKGKWRFDECKWKR